jgi:hypothetical protein
MHNMEAIGIDGDVRPRTFDSATLGLKSISAVKSATEIGGPENERSFAKGPHEISCLSEVDIVGLASKRASA